MGYFHKLMLSDIFVVLDTTQFEKNSFVNRNRVRTAQGSTWLTIPMKTKGHLGRTIREMAWDETVPWQRKHVETIRQAYSRAAYFDRYFPAMREFLESASGFSPLLMNMLRYFAGELGAATRIVAASDVAAGGRKSELVLNICRELGAGTYVAGAQGADYLDRDAFRAAGVDVWVQAYTHPVYRQFYQPFEPFMGIIDCLMNHGASETAALVFEGNATKAQITP